MGPESSEVLTPNFEPPKDFFLQDTSYSEALVQHIQGDRDKNTASYFQQRLQEASLAGKIDDTLSPGLNVTSILAAAKKLQIQIPTEKQWEYYQIALQNSATILAARATEDPDATDYYLEKSQEAKQKSLEIQAILEQQGIKIHQASENQAEENNNRQKEHKETTESPEDEYVESVKAVAIKGLFPNGLQLKGKVLRKPGPQLGFETYSDSGFNLYQNRFIRAGEAMFVQQTGNGLTVPHAVTVIPYMPSNFEVNTQPLAAEYQTGFSIIVYHTLLDGSTTDDRRRPILEAKTYFLMPTDKATALIDKVEKEDNGADIFEHFIQKAAPDVMAKDSASPGIRRESSQDLLVLDEQLRKNILPDEVFYESANTQQKISTLLRQLSRIPHKQYSQPVGVQ